ncbi:carboxylating nicotinate-nucleotide diphosphorylase [Thalassospira xiamenensis]|uniref:Probable nicotinate-nucleotide pyrophosphorylase [carboxylating] n=1 Tax=Thalassospira xiamenensis TaxID=220697 RepID=A0A367X8S4_9PROT|nr:carboxylating nicotinate-nucleotide diphosphorylase [Thalassospira xiamenensis]KZB55913.1 nicotinate-nucleotide pyrophosphorylase [Thalassospira xiamenensis]RCK50065.1 nicotinate-nucleotide pyrophosphorylase [Thalassospira xiamenensis]
MMKLPAIPKLIIERTVTAALLEDYGRSGDITSSYTLPAGQTAEACVVAREDGILCGLDYAKAAFRLSGGNVRWEKKSTDGDRVRKGDIIATVRGDAIEMLSSERVALNYLGHLSGISSDTDRFVENIRHTGAKMCCTRKTTPGLRLAEKYAVKCGGGANHRFGLDDAVLIKDNHIAVCGSLKDAVLSVRAQIGHLVSLEVEVDTLSQMREALDLGVGVILLDNFTIEELRQAVAVNKGAAKLEASGGVTIDNVKDIAETGVDYISSSKITMSAPAFDFGLDIRIIGAK